MVYDDDEPIQKISEDIPKGPGDSVNTSISAGVQIKIDRKEDVTTEATKFPVLVEVTGTAKANERMGVDIVTVLDVSWSMNEQNKIGKMKRAMAFLIRKLSPNDRLSIVTFSTTATRVCKLRQMTEDAKLEVAEMVEELRADWSTNTYAGLHMAVQVLNDRKDKTGRAMAIMLMSDGDQNEGPDPLLVNVGDIPVHTFGLGSGTDYKPLELEAIKKLSPGGTFSYAEVDDTDESNLTKVFSQCLAGLLSIVVHELKVTIQPGGVQGGGVQTKPDIVKVSAGDYRQTRDDSDGSVTISFGNLYRQEVRKIVVDLNLPLVVIKQPTNTDIIVVRHSFTRVSSVVRHSNPTFIQVRRTDTPVAKESDALKAEILRVKALDTIMEAINSAEQGNFMKATMLISTTLGEIYDEEFDVPNANASIEALIEELDKLQEYMQNQQIYDKKGRPFALSSKSSHSRQRFAGRGDHIDTIRPHATPRMGVLLDQAADFHMHRNPALVKSVEDDEEAEAVVD